MTAGPVPGVLTRTPASRNLAASHSRGRVASFASHAASMPLSDECGARLNCGVVGETTDKREHQGLTLVHLSAQPEPFLSLIPPNVSHKKCLR